MTKSAQGHYHRCGGWITDLSVAVEAVWLLLLFKRRLSNSKRRTLQDYSRSVLPAQVKSVEAELVSEARRAARIVNGISRRLPGHYSCLVRTMALGHILSKRGCPVIFGWGF